jgi:hypothetical protein
MKIREDENAGIYKLRMGNSSRWKIENCENNEGMNFNLHMDIFNVGLEIR